MNKNKNLELVTTEKFGVVDCNFYKNDDEIWLSRDQIGTALEYSQPRTAICKIHNRHIDRLDKLSVTTKMVSTDGKTYDTCLYSQRGIMEICRWSASKKSNEFMDWVWDVIEKYRNNTLYQPQNNLNIIPEINKIVNESVGQIVDDLKYNFIKKLSLAFAMQLKQTDKDIKNIINYQNNLQKSQEDIVQKVNNIYSYIKSPCSSWFVKMCPRYELLEDYFNIDRRELYNNLIMELENLYPDINVDNIQRKYLKENNLENCFVMDAVEHTEEVRKLMELLVDSLLDKYNLNNKLKKNKKLHKTIFN